MLRLKLLLALIVIAMNISAQHVDTSWTKLFNGKDLSGWNKYLAQPLDSAGKAWYKTPLGLNNDPQNIFTVVKDHREKVIRVSGQSWGAISTLNDYSNYHLQLKFKWGKYTWAGKRGKPMDSGLLYHSSGTPIYSGWMQSQEFQIEEGNCGDYWTIGKVRQSIPSTWDTSKKYIYDPAGPVKIFGDSNINWCHRATANEHPAGEWNTLDLYCFGDTSMHVVNGNVVMVLYNSRQLINDERIPLTSGKIQLQSEGAELFFKDVRIQNIEHLPAIANK
jgi:hypothetical protein